MANFRNATISFEDGSTRAYYKITDYYYNRKEGTLYLGRTSLATLDQLTYIIPTHNVTEIRVSCYNA